MRLGTVVVVLGKLDQRVRETTESLVQGTLVEIDAEKNAWVLLAGGDFWRGPMREIARACEQTSPETSETESPPEEESPE